MIVEYDTIFALATPPGIGGIAIIRISGARAKDVLEAVFLPAGKCDYASHMMYYGTLTYNGEVADDCMAVYMHAPKTYTAEDVAELHLHGGRIPVKKALDILSACGLRMAEPGEFTKRAFLNGRIDLSQSEAVMDFISATSEFGANASLMHMRGQLSKKLEPLKDELLGILAQIEACVDYPEEDMDEEVLGVAFKAIDTVCPEIQSLLDTADFGAIVREGISVAIAGKPNVGKSSLLNALLGKERVIVTDIPGTTRDTLEEYYVHKGLTIRFIDTAGIRETEDKIEGIGVERSKQAIEQCDVLLLVVDGADGIDDEDIAVFDRARGKNTLVLINKSDKKQKVSDEQVQNAFPEASRVNISAKESSGLEELLDKVYAMAADVTMINSDIIITNARHKKCLQTANDALNDAKTAIGEKTEPDCISIDVRNAWHSLCEITGEALDEDVIDRIFEKFCLGK